MIFEEIVLPENNDLRKYIVFCKIKLSLYV
mgnify:CR=1 FL=1